MNDLYKELINQTFGHSKHDFMLSDIGLLLDNTFHYAEHHPWKHVDDKLPEDGDLVLIIQKGSDEPLKAKFYETYTDFNNSYLNCFVSILSGKILDGVEYWMLVPPIERKSEPYRHHYKSSREMMTMERDNLIDRILTRNQTSYI